MADITITYNDQTIAELSESATRALKTKGKFCTNDIVLRYEKPSGGGTAALSQNSPLSFNGAIPTINTSPISEVQE